MQSITLKSFAKLNMALNILGKMEGYHKIDSIVTSINLYDVITITARKDRQIFLSMHGQNSEYIPQHKNNAYKAAQVFLERFHTNGVNISIEKKIPIGAGLGGSSADCAGVLNAMAKLFAVQNAKAIKEIADSLGSDTAYMLHGGLARLRGRGEKIKHLKMQQKLYFLLLFPKGSVNTAKCYQKYDELPIKKQTNIAALSLALRDGQLNTAVQWMQNALQEPACILNKEILPALQVLKENHPPVALVTGSGSGVYALYFSYEACKNAQKKLMHVRSKIVIPMKKGYEICNGYRAYL